jgi:3alpha(or 20beta)-hydroxysteroid dehydrogenase
MADEGAKVVVADVQDEEGRALTEEIGPAATYVHLDVTRPEEWKSAVGAAIRAFGRLNVLVNNAGIATYGPIEKYAHADWEKTIRVNLTGVFNGIKAGIPALRNAGGGSIINISSAAGILAHPVMAGYVASKFGVRGLTKVAALELAQYGIRVNSVHPGVIQTPLAIAGPAPDMSRIAMGRMGKPEEVGSLVVFLASDESSFSTGSEFILDGGQTAGLTLFAWQQPEHAAA